MWRRTLTYETGRWRGEIETAGRVMAVHSTWYGAAKFRKGAAPPPKVAATLEKRTAVLVERLPSLTHLVCEHLTTMWNAKWRDANSPMDTQVLEKELVPTTLHFNAGEKGDEYMLEFAPMALFRGREVHLTVSRDVPRKIWIESPRDKGKPTLPSLDLEMSFIEIKTEKSAPQPSLPATGDTSWVWKTALRHVAREDGFAGKVEAMGRTFSVHASTHSGAVDEARAGDDLALVLRSLGVILEQVAERAAALYEASWSDATKKPMDAATVLRKTKLKSVAVDGTRFTLLLSDGGLFGRHTVEASGEHTPTVDAINLLG
jgi:hypothetical protein